VSWLTLPAHQPATATAPVLCWVAGSLMCNFVAGPVVSRFLLQRASVSYGEVSRPARRETSVPPPAVYHLLSVAGRPYG